MTIKNIALINNLDQVVNHVIADVDDKSVMDMLYSEWGAVRHVETQDTDPIILNPDPEIWTIHTEQDGFVPPPPIEVSIVMSDVMSEETPSSEPRTVTINGRVYPKDSRLIKENNHLRPEGWVLPEGEIEVSLKDAE